MISRSARTVMLGTMFVASLIGAAPSAKAEGGFDSIWNAVLVTKSGPCEPSYRGQVRVTNGVVSVAGASQHNLSGRVSPTGSVTATASMGVSYGTATGKLSNNSGGGSWRAQMQNGACSGVWSARRD
jgi:hypothetical protein